MSLARVLCVDDEPRVLEGIHRVFRKHYEISTAQSGAIALQLLAAEAPFEVVISDMRMPEMNGATLLAEFRQRSPDTTRVLLTGQTDIESAIAAVNQGQIFRFLTKPCPPEQLGSAIESAVTQHRLVTSERVLLEQTLVGSIRALTEVLGLVNPEIFGPAMRQHERARATAELLGVADAWHVEVASMLSSVGYVVLPGDVATKLRSGLPLDAAERDMVSQVPAVVERVLAHIPRLDKVRSALIQPEKSGGDARAIPVGARILEAVRALAALEMREGTTARALVALRASGRHAVDVLQALSTVCEGRAPEIAELAIAQIRVGMVLVSSVHARGGMLLVAAGQPVTDQLLQRLRNFHARLGVVEPVACEIPAAITTRA